MHERLLNLPLLPATLLETKSPTQATYKGQSPQQSAHLVPAAITCGGGGLRAHVWHAPERQDEERGDKKRHPGQEDHEDGAAGEAGGLEALDARRPLQGGRGRHEHPADEGAHAGGGGGGRRHPHRRQRGCAGTHGEITCDAPRGRAEGMRAGIARANKGLAAFMAAVALHACLACATHISDRKM